MRQRSRIVLGLLCTVLAATSVTGPSEARTVADGAAAVAAASEEVVSQRYSDHRYVSVEEFNLCLSIYATSTLRATYKRQATSQGAVSSLKEPRIIDPRIQVWVKKSCDDDSAYKSRHRINKFTFRNFYYGYTCSFNPSFSVGAPWSVGVGVTPDCGDERVAQYGVTEKGTSRATHFDLDTQGFALRWNASDSVTEPGSVKLCTSVSSWLRMRDTVGAKRKTLIKKVRLDDACISE